MEQDKFEEMIRKYLEDNLKISIREKYGWEGKYLEVKIFLGNDVIAQSET
jgi:hypothetical protein